MSNRFRTVTFKSSSALITELVKIYKEEASAILDVEGLLPAFAFQPISKNILENMQKDGGNALGLTPDRGPLMSEYPLFSNKFEICLQVRLVMNMNWGWAHAKDDARVLGATANLINRALALGKKMKLDDPFIYMNYASLDAPVYEGYGIKNVLRLKLIKIKYDLLNVFGHLWKGYFKL